MVSASLVQTNGSQRSFQPSMKPRIASTSSRTEPKVPADRLAGDDPEEDLHHVQPGTRGRGEVQRDPRVALEPRLDPWMLVGGVVVGDHVQRHPGIGLGDLLEELEELLVAVTLEAGVGDL